MSNAWRALLQLPRLRPRLSVATLIAITVALLLPDRLSWVTRALVSWDAGTALYVALALVMFTGATPAHMRTRAAALDEGAWTMLFVIVAAAIASVIAIVMELANVKDLPRLERLPHLLLGVVTLTCSWVFVHTSFALHYAHEFYMHLKERGEAALQFPQTHNEREPDYWDFMYFSFVLGMTSQTSDIQIAAPTLRRLALLHGVMAFFFNATLLALAVNAAAGLL